MKIGTIEFVGDRLREGREARGFTAAALAVPLEVTPPAITQYEKDIQSPRPEVMSRIVSTLQLPLPFFLRKHRRDEGVVFWRSLSSATELAQTVCERRIGWVQDIFAALREPLEFTPGNIPDLDIPRDPLAITDEVIEAAASHVRTYWRLGDGPIANVTRTLEDQGVIIASDDLGAATLDALSKWCAGENRAYILASSTRKSTARFRLNVLHELGHMVLHRHLDRWHLENKRLHKLIEDQAFRFAGVFALPTESFAADVYSLSLDSFIGLKEKWKFAISMMLKRCESLDIGSESSLRKLWISLASRGWKMNEPLDDEIPPEPPETLAQSIRYLNSEGIISSKLLCEICALPPKDVEGLAGLRPGEINPVIQDGVTVISDGSPNNRPKRIIPGQVLTFPKAKLS